MHDQLKSHIGAVIEGLSYLSVDDAGDLLREAADELATGDKTEDAQTEAILDGLRWGYAAAVKVEMGGGAILRAIFPGGGAITHEWASEADAHPQISAALQAVQATRVVVTGAGEG